MEWGGGIVGRRKRVGGVGRREKQGCRRKVEEGF